MIPLVPRWSSLYQFARPGTLANRKVLPINTLRFAGGLFSPRVAPCPKACRPGLRLAVFGTHAILSR
jgi:hypothetical protein